LREHLQSYIHSLQAIHQITNSFSLESSDASDVNVHLQHQIREQWPQVLCEESKKELVQDFKNKTSSNALKLVMCACCAEDVLKHQSQEVLVNDMI
jgi:hypothetical protein